VGVLKISGECRRADKSGGHDRVFLGSEKRIPLKTTLHLLALALLLTAPPALAQNAALRQKHFFIEKSVALQGYDPVSYFAGRPLKGKTDFTQNYGGVTYRFANAANLETFRKDPARYEPQYGGWCAYAMGSDGSKVEVDPETYKLIDGKLFLFYNRFFNNTLKTWNGDEARLHRQADANWAKTFR
jgi:YHS domain-containing protein